MAETAVPAARGTRWLGDVLAGHIGGLPGAPVRVTLFDRRARYDIYRANEAGVSALVKVGPMAELIVEARRLHQAVSIVGSGAPRRLAFFAAPDGTGVLAMEYLPGGHLEPGRLTSVAWRRLVSILLRLHRQGESGSSVCFPLAPDFVTLSVRQDEYASLPQLRPLLAAEAGRAPGLDAVAALALFDTLAAEFDVHRSSFQRPSRLVHADLWPQNILTDGSRCWLVDWIGLKQGDYALDLANLKLVLDWVWPPWRAHGAFEALLRLYARAFADDTLLTRIRVLLPLVSLIHLVQFGQGGVDDPENVAAMHAALAVAQRDRALWARPTPSRRLLYALAHRRTSEYGVMEGSWLRARARRALSWLQLTKAGPRQDGGG